MKTPTSLFLRQSAALCLALGALAGLTNLSAQTTLTLGVSGNGGNGSGADFTRQLFSLTAPYLLQGTTTNDQTPWTLGGGFRSNSPDGGTATQDYLLSVNTHGATLGAGTDLPFTYDFTFNKDSNVVGDVTWVLYLSDSVDTSLVSYATGTLSGSSQDFTGSGTFHLTSAVPAGTNLRADFLTTFTALPTGEAQGTMFSGTPQGITFLVPATSAVPEPSTYAALAGVAMLGLAIWQRRRQPQV